VPQIRGQMFMTRGRLTGIGSNLPLEARASDIPGAIPVNEE